MNTNKKLLEKELAKLCKNNKQNFGRILSHLKRSFDEWALAHLSKEGYPEVKMAYMPFLMNIEIDGITNNVLAQKLRISKQAMSKTLKELENLNLIEAIPNPTDARSSIILLTTYGMKMVIHTRKKLDNLTKDYIAVIGKKKFFDMIESLNTIIEIHKEID
jgi:DNA-binding MarR family transcriptional regulator